jgi:anhydro-N-acetylmuramic acid kinase
VQERFIIGCMSGTSIDGIDAALLRITGTGLSLGAHFIAADSTPMGDLAPRLRAIASQQPITAHDITRAAADLATLHIDLCTRLWNAHAPPRTAAPSLISIHGQTVFHQPPLSWQLLQPAPIARALHAPVVFDLRAADLAAGGQGAPLTPLADLILFRNFGDPASPLAIANLGGFCNITLLPEGRADPARITAADLCPCNNLLDEIARRLLHTPFDHNGAAAAEGDIHPDALEDLEGIFIALAGSRRSLGTGDETGEWLSRYRAHLSAPTLAATACEAIAQRIADATHHAPTLLLAGGGVKNLALRRAIASCSASRVLTTDDAGLPASSREAAAWAILGALCQDHCPISLPAVTGVTSPAPVCGAWVYPPYS